MTSMTGNMGPTGGNKIPSGYRLGRISQFTPQQNKLFGQMFEHAGPESYLGRLAGGDQSQFDEMEAPAMRQFAQMQGQMGSRFSGMGQTGARGSSGFKLEAGQQASDFAQQLQANRQNLQRQAIMDLRGLSSELLGQRPYEQFLTQKQQKQGTNWGGLAGGAIGGIGGFFASGGNPMGAMAGAGLGYNVGSGLSGSQSQSQGQSQMPNMFSFGGGGGGNYGSQGFQSHAGPHYNFPSP